MTNVPDFVRDNVIALKARIAELEAELAEETRLHDETANLAVQAERCLAAVIALCEELTVSRYGRVWADVDMVLAAATGDTK